MRRELTLLSLVLLAALFGTDAQAKKREYAPLPDALMNAKTVCIINKTPWAVTADRAYNELRRWGRFRIVPCSENPDLGLVFFGETHVAGYSGTSRAETTGDVDMDEDRGHGTITATTRGTSSSSADYGGSVSMHVVDGRTNKEIWANTTPFSIRGATHNLINDLRKRMENQSH
jgi:hypothetical protein